MKLRLRALGARVVIWAAVLAAVGTAGGGPASAQATDPLCANPMETCSADVSRQCLLRLGAGSLSAEGGQAAQTDDACGAQLAAYRSCLADVATRCDDGGRAAEGDSRSPRERIVAMGLKWELGYYSQAVQQNDTAALALFHEGGFQNQRDHGCFGLSRALQADDGARPKVVLDALSEETLAGMDCRKALASDFPRELRRNEVGPAALAQIVTGACFRKSRYKGRYFVDKRCARDGAVAEVATRAALAARLKPVRAAFGAAQAALASPSRRAEVCGACAARKTKGLDDGVPYSAICPTLAPFQSVLRFASANGMRTSDPRAIQAFCRASKRRAEETAAIVESALAAADRLEALGRGE